MRLLQLLNNIISAELTAVKATYVGELDWLAEEGLIYIVCELRLTWSVSGGPLR